MRVLVSVRSADEVAAAIAGGADIIDAKDPARGALGPVEPEELAAIARAVPDSCPLSVALGDPAGLEELAAAFSSVNRLPARQGELFVKIGLAGVRDRDALDALLAGGVRLAATGGRGARVMAMALADGETPPDQVTAAAAAAGVHGVVLDTGQKDGRDLFAWLGEAELVGWIADARRRGLQTALAGSLSRDGIGRAGRLGPDIVGARGAACRGGRLGRVDEGLVRLLVSAAHALDVTPVSGR
jgi:uncharacterized protein (UPF0264 family)